MKIIDIIDLLDDDIEIKFINDKYDCATLKIKDLLNENIEEYLKRKYEIKELDKFYFYNYKNKIDNQYYSYEEIFNATIKHIKISKMSNTLLLVLN